MTSYEALRSRVAWIDLSGRGQIRATGEDRARLLHAMSTNDINRLAEGGGLYAFFLTAQGRIIGDANIYNLGDSLWLDTEREIREKLLAHLDKYIIADDVTLEDETENRAVIALEGPGAIQAAASLGIEVPKAELAIVRWGEAFAVRTSVTGLDGVRLFLPSAAKAAFVPRLEEAGIPRANFDQVKVLRLENGRARYGEDISERYLVQETQLLSAVSFNKGCYLGQEIVERVRSRGQVHRLLTSVRIATASAPAPGTRLKSNDKEVGEITSAAFSPALEESVALAYLRAESSAKGTRLTLEDGNEAYVP